MNRANYALKLPSYPLVEDQKPREAQGLSEVTISKRGVSCTSLALRTIQSWKALSEGTC